ncbi:MAG: MFS transporter [Anaerolineae bacterium]
MSSSDPAASDFRTGDVTLVAAAHWSHDTYTAFLPQLLPELMSTLSFSTAQGGLLTTFLQGPSLIQPLFGYLGERINLRAVVILAPALTAVAMSLLGVAPSYAMLALLLVIAGSSSALFHAVVPVLAGDLSGGSLGKGMGFWMVGGELGRMLGPLIAAGGIALLGLKGLPWLMVGGLLASLLLSLRFRRVPVVVTPATTQTLDWKGALLAMRPLALPLLGLLIARAFMTSALLTYFPTFLQDEGMGNLRSGIYLSVLQFAGVVGALIGGRVSDRLGRKRILALALATTSLLMFAFLAVPEWGRVPLLLPLGFASLSITPVLMAFVQESFPENRTLANSIYMGTGFLIRAGIVYVVGLLGDALGLRAAFTICAGVTLVGLPFIIWLPVRKS